MKGFYKMLLPLVTFFYLDNVSAQTFPGLDQHLSGTSTKVYYSVGHKERAKAVAVQIDDAMDFYKAMLDLRPEVTLLVLSPEDWKKHTSFPVYGMPHYTNEKTLVVASSDNAFWKSFLPSMDQLPEEIKTEVQKAYGSNGAISMQPFFDLLAIHELGHAYHFQGGLIMQRKWMGELFCNMFLHTFIAEKTPALLPALTAFPRMVVGGGTKNFLFTSLEQLEKNYTLIATTHPQNYGWYQSKLHVASEQIYRAGGKLVLKQLWERLKSKADVKKDEELVEFLKSTVHQSVSDVMLRW